MAKWIFYFAPETGAGAGASAAAAPAAGAAAAAPVVAAAGGAAAPAAGAGASVAGATTAAAAQAQGGDPSAPYRPEGLPDHLFAGNDKGTIDALWRMAQGYRTRDSERGTVPEKPDGYAFTPSDALKPYEAVLGDDPFFKGVREDALAAGLGDKQFSGFMNKVLERMITSEMVDAPYDEAAEKALLVPDAARNLDDKEKGIAIDRRIRDNVAYVEAMKARGLSATTADSLISELGDRAHMNLFVEFMRGQVGGGAQPGTGGSGSVGLSGADLANRQADPRNDPYSAKFDKAFQEETYRLYQQTYGA